MKLRDGLLPVLDRLRQIPDNLGIRRYSVILRKRSWPGGVPGKGTPKDVDVEIVPKPRVRLLTAKEVADAGGTYATGDYKVEKITPKYAAEMAGGRTGWSPGQIIQAVGAQGDDIALLLVGDEGTIECTPVEYHFDRPFNYWLVARRRRQAGG